MPSCDYLTIPIVQPVFGYLRLGRVWHQVKCVKAHFEPDGIVKNEVVTADGRTFIVDGRKLKFRMLRPTDVPHPEAPPDTMFGKGRGGEPFSPPQRQ